MDRAPAIPRVIPGFPYVSRNCPYCQEPLTMVNVTHVLGEEEHYKAIMICYNGNCGYYDMPCREAYVKVYYSSQRAADELSALMLRFDRPSVGPVRTDEIKDPEEGLDVFFDIKETTKERYV